MNFLKNFLKKDPEIIDINPGTENLRKVLCWRVLSVIISIGVAYYFLGHIESSIKLTMVEAILLTGTHYIFEEVWSK